jgi:hypothetical protein
LIACTGHTWSEIDLEWDIPRLDAWTRSIGRLPPLQAMVGRYIGYPMPESPDPKLSPDDAAARLMGQLTGMN